MGELRFVYGFFIRLGLAVLVELSQFDAIGRRLLGCDAVLFASGLAYRVGDIGKDGGAARGDLPLREEIQNADQEAGDGLEGTDAVELGSEGGDGSAMLRGMNGAVKSVRVQNGLTAVASFRVDVSADGQTRRLNRRSCERFHFENLRTARHKPAYADLSGV